MDFYIFIFSVFSIYCNSVFWCTNRLLYLHILILTCVCATMQTILLIYFSSIVCVSWAAIRPVYYIWLWHHYYGLTGRICAHCPLRCVCHLSLNGKSFWLFSTLRGDLLQLARGGTTTEKRRESRIERARGKKKRKKHCGSFSVGRKSQEGRGEDRLRRGRRKWEGGVQRGNPIPLRARGT